MFDEVYDDKRVSLLKMNFPAKEVEFAMDKLGELLNFLSGEFLFVCYEIDLQLALRP